MKKTFFLLAIAALLMALSAPVALAGGDKVHGVLGEGGVFQYCNEPGDCPWDED